MNSSTLALPTIALSATDVERLRRLASAAQDRFPRTADFLAREVERAQVIELGQEPSGLVRMGSQVTFRDDTNGRVRKVVLVYPDEADIDAGRVSVLTPIGAALIGLSVGQSIEWQAPTGGARSLTVLEALPPGA